MKQARKVLGAAVFAALLGAVWVGQLIVGDEPRDRVILSERTTPNTVKRVPTLPRQSSEPAPAGNVSRPLVAALEKSPKVLVHAADTVDDSRASVIAVIDNYSDYVAAAATGDEAAAVALFTAAAACFQLDPAKEATVGGPQPTRRTYSRRQGCEGVPESLAIERLSWLRLAASRGGSLAALYYGLNVRSITERDSDSPAAQMGAVVHDDAISHLQLAASRGLRDAYLALSLAYQTGEFGVVDPIAAYAYLYALDRMDIYSSLNPILAAQRGRLTTKQLSAANEQAAALIQRCCK